MPSKYLNRIIEYDGLQFKSTLEKRAYQIYTEAGFNPKYEPTMFTIWPKHVLNGNVTCYKPFKRKLSNTRRTLGAISYTPDFMFTYKGAIIIIDTKGKPNETYPMKFKMFLKHCEEIYDCPVYFFEPHSITQIKQSVTIIKNIPYHK